jgi:hypothetical protein
MEQLEVLKGKVKDSLFYIHSSQCVKAIKRHFGCNKDETWDSVFSVYQTFMVIETCLEATTLRSKVTADMQP